VYRHTELVEGSEASHTFIVPEYEAASEAGVAKDAAESLSSEE